MSLRQRIAGALEGHSGAGELAVSEGPYSLTLDLTAAAPVGVAFGTLQFAVADRAPLGADQLHQWGERLAARLTYLMEPLVVLEVDAHGGEVEMRSQKPTQRDGLRAYYELRLGQPHSLRLSRTVYDEAARQRRPAPCQLTREALERLADDLVASVA